MAARVYAMEFLAVLSRRVDWSAVLLFASTIAVFVIPMFIIFPPVPVEQSDALGQTHSKLGRPLAQHGTCPAPTQQHQHQTTQSSTTTTSIDAAPLEVPSPTAVVYPIKACRGIDVSRAEDQRRIGSLRCDSLYTFAQPASAALPPADRTGTGDARQGRPASHEDGDVDQWEALTRSDVPPLADVKIDVWLPDEAKSSRLLGRVEGGFVVARFPWADDGVEGGEELLRRLARVLAAKLSRGLRAVPEMEMRLPLEFPPEADIASRGYRGARVALRPGDVRPALNMEAELPPGLARHLGIKQRLGILRLCDDGLGDDGRGTA
ncbi:hypothetical protein JDV02_007681 [Purpureocillium takamizusanense]|uniref:Uncharacterized protein n=1 Tax=Purpureocillium takamizusanense TaxID=2060973 RepID=A0A9Q8QMY0_9HYPO|nr:uncharacterized protein JDV02_007681 [Purpureocillium takamizusanense]UNI21721.1 hypothetical protein JDV02_007681 [Purpureocillium takamizusanense]